MRASHQTDSTAISRVPRLVSPVDLRSASFRNIQIMLRKAWIQGKSQGLAGSVVPPTHSVALFSMKSLTSGLSKVANVPVAPDDGLAKFICGICDRKLLSADSFITTAIF